jgi:cholesterol oxidase
MAPSIKYMLYRLFFTDHNGRQLTVSGTKDIQDRPGSDVWRATTALYTRILKGHITKEADEAKNPEVLEAMTLGAGIIIISLLDSKTIDDFARSGAAWPSI